MRWIQFNTAKSSTYLLQSRELQCNADSKQYNGTDLKFATVTVLAQPVFSASPTSGAAPLGVIFTDNSTGSPASWTWIFGDGNTSTEKNPVHVYNKTGQYTVSLTVNNSGSISTETRSRYIAISK